MGRPVDAIALNAGVGAAGDFTRETDLAADLNVIDLNIRSTVHLAKLVLKDMVQRGAGRVLFTSSIASTMPGTYNAIYNASKAFVQSFSQAIRSELKDTGVTITALMPGATETNFFHRAGMDDTKLGMSEKDDAAEVAKAGYDALMEGKDHVIAGSFSNKVQATMAHVLPDTVMPKCTRSSWHRNREKNKKRSDRTSRCDPKEIYERFVTGLPTRSFGGLQICDRTSQGFARTRRRSGNSTFASDLLAEVQSDTDILRGVIEKVGESHFDLKEVAGWLAEKASRFKLGHENAGGLGVFEALETLSLGIMGKLALWRVLSIIEDNRIPQTDFAKLAASAQSQYSRVEEYRLRMARSVFVASKVHSARS